MFNLTISVSMTADSHCSPVSRGPKKKEVDPKLLFPLKAWVKTFHPDHWKDWNRETGLPARSDKEDWVQLDDQVHVLEKYLTKFATRRYGAG